MWAVYLPIIDHSTKANFWHLIYGFVDNSGFIYSLDSSLPLICDLKLPYILWDNDIFINTNNENLFLWFYDSQSFIELNLHFNFIIDLPELLLMHFFPFGKEIIWPYLIVETLSIHPSIFIDFEFITFFKSSQFKTE